MHTEDQDSIEQAIERIATFAQEGPVLPSSTPTTSRGSCMIQAATSTNGSHDVDRWMERLASP